jgi:predicted transcriptional regulator
VTLPEILAAELAAQSLSVYGWAKAAGVPVGTAQFVLAGTDPRLQTLRKLLAGLGKDLGWLQSRLAVVPDG